MGREQSKLPCRDGNAIRYLLPLPSLPPPEIFPTQQQFGDTVQWQAFAVDRPDEGFGMGKGPLLSTSPKWLGGKTKKEKEGHQMHPLLSQQHTTLTEPATSLPTFPSVEVTGYGWDWMNAW
jgi:hypothetical protein